MIAKEQNSALLIIGNHARVNPDWIDYANYCLNREKGLRKEAFQNLNKFLESSKFWTYEQEIDFTKFLLPFFETVKEADLGPFPQPLKDKLIKPVLIKWCANEKKDSSPFRWYGKYYLSEEHLLKALEINPADGLARQTILDWWMHDIYYSVHHLPEGYIGEPYDDLKLGEKMKQQILQLTTSELREYWTNELEEDLELIRNYIDWQNSGHSVFEEWGKENKRLTGYGITRVYY